jgi:hypothetical protein
MLKSTEMPLLSNFEFVHSTQFHDFKLQLKRFRTIFVQVLEGTWDQGILTLESILPSSKMQASKSG